MGRLGETRLDTTPSARLLLRMVCLRLYSLLSIAGCAGSDGGLRAMGRSRGGAAWSTAIRRRWPQTQLGMRAAGRSGAASRSMCQAGASTSRCHWSRTRKESRAACGQEEQVQSRGTNHANVRHGGANRFTLISDSRSSVRIVIKQLFKLSVLVIAVEWDVAGKDSHRLALLNLFNSCRKGFKYCR
jgi:hypothetical protein